LMGENLRSKEALVDVQSVLTRMSLIEEST
jgi:hypothetical protein